MTIEIPEDEATDRQLLRAVLHNQGITHELLAEMSAIMADVNASLDTLTAAVDEVGVEFADLSTQLQAAIAAQADVQAQLAAALANDASDAATIADLTAQLQAANEAVAGVAERIDAQSARLNQLGTPVAPAPVDEQPAV
jgi:ABC-type transporter Mla subunit MlaD